MEAILNLITVQLISAANPALLPYIWAELAVLFAGKSQTALMIFVFSIFLEVTTIYYAYAWFFLSMDKKKPLRSKSLHFCHLFFSQ